MSRLDRFLVSAGWINLWNNVSQIGLPRGVSDHNPIMLFDNVSEWGPKPIRIFDHWCRLPDFRPSVEKLWNENNVEGWAGYRIWFKCKELRTGLAKLVASNNGDPQKKIDQLQAEIDSLDKILECRDLNDSEYDNKLRLDNEYWETQNKLESNLRQQAREKWIKEGDLNSKYFHTVIKARRRRNEIRRLITSGKYEDNPDLVKELVFSFFKDHFTAKQGNRPKLWNLDFPSLSEASSKILENQFSMEEIEMALHDCNGDKAPGPDGFNFNFIKKFWHLLKGDVRQFFDEFHINGKLSKGVNASFIKLIPKVDCPKDLKEYRPISMVGWLYKLLSKVLANRLRNVLGELIGVAQSAFLSGRQILDGSLIANEVVDHIKSSGEKALLFKVDFERAYDSVDWEFLDFIQWKMGFGSTWRQWIRECLSTASLSILVNGCPTKDFFMERGLRQGDPISPFLFLIVAEALNRMLMKAANLGLLSGVRVGSNGIMVSHLQFADDTIIFCRAVESDALAVKRTLRCFELCSGMKINFSKSSLIGIQVEERWVSNMASKLCCKTDCFPVKYLGLPLGGKQGALSFWDPVVSKFYSKLAGWKKKILSLGGRITLIKAVFSSLPIYYMSLFKMPVGVAKKLEGIMRNFLWDGLGEKKKPHLLNWQTVSLSKWGGGLGFGDLKQRNLALLAKWCGRYGMEHNALWRSIISSKYSWNEDVVCPLEHNLNKRNTIWGNIIESIKGDPIAYEVYREGWQWVLGNGHKIRFWLDEWTNQGALRVRFPRLFALAVNKRGHIDEYGKWEANFWVWNIEWRRSCFNWEIEHLTNLMNCLNKCKLVANREDSLVWKASPNGNFSVKSFRQLMEKKKNVPKFLPYVWKGIAPPKVESFVWLAMHGRISVTTVLKRLKILPNEVGDICRICNQEPETVDHILLHCQWSWRIWNGCLEWWGYKWCCPRNIKECFSSWVGDKRKNLAELTWDMLFFATVWSIWLGRNDAIFRGKVLSPSLVIDIIIKRVAHWVKAKNDDMEIPIVEFKESIQLIKNSDSSSRDRAIVVWSPPTVGSLKFNIDGSVKGVPGDGGIGGVLRNEEGSILCVFAAAVGAVEPCQAEALAIKRALEICSQNFPDWRGRIIIECDAKNVVNYVNKKESRPWKLWQVLWAIDGLMERIQGDVICSYIDRNANGMADLLAKAGVGRSHEMFATF